MVKKFLPVFMVALMTLLPACCVSHLNHPSGKLTLPEQLELKTVAMVHWVKPDSDGDEMEVEPDTEGASLVPYCTGVWISKNTFITANHCVDHLGKPTEQALIESLVPPEHWKDVGIKRWNPTNQPALYSNFGDIRDTGMTKVRSTHPAVVLAVDPEEDLALVRVAPDALDPKVAEHDVASIAGEARVGEEVHVVGHTMGLWWTYSHGFVAQFRNDSPPKAVKPTDVIQVSAPVFFGNSGGGAFNADGQLLGIASWIVQAPEVGFFIKFDVVDRFMQHNRGSI